MPVVNPRICRFSPFGPVFAVRNRPFPAAAGTAARKIKKLGRRGGPTAGPENFCLAATQKFACLSRRGFARMNRESCLTPYRTRRLQHTNSKIQKGQPTGCLFCPRFRSVTLRVGSSDPRRLLTSFVVLLPSSARRVTRWSRTSGPAPASRDPPATPQSLRRGGGGRAPPRGRELVHVVEQRRGLDRGDVQPRAPRGRARQDAATSATAHECRRYQSGGRGRAAGGRSRGAPGWSCGESYRWPRSRRVRPGPASGS